MAGPAELRLPSIRHLFPGTRAPYMGCEIKLTLDVEYFPANTLNNAAPSPLIPQSLPQHIPTLPSTTNPAPNSAGEDTGNTETETATDDTLTVCIFAVKYLLRC